MAGVTWAGQTFTSKQQLASWLAAHGANYTHWASLHPAAAASLEGGAAAPQAPLYSGPGTGTTGSYQDMLNNEPIYQSDLANLAAQDAADKAGLRSNLSSLIAQYGGVPAGFSDPNLDPAAIAAGQANPYSQLAQLAKTRDASRGDMIAQRMARGVYGSGGTKLQEKEIGYQYGLGQYNALNNLMQAINSAEGGYAQSVRDRLGQQQGYLSDAMQRLIDAGYSPQQAAAAVGGGAGTSPGGSIGLGGSGSIGAGPSWTGPSVAQMLAGQGGGRVLTTFQGGPAPASIAAGNAKYGTTPTPFAHYVDPNVLERRRLGTGPSSLGTVPNNAAGAAKFPGIFG